jgi:hypothetical protein
MPVGEVRCGLESSRSGGLQGMSSLQLSLAAATALLQCLPPLPLLLKLRGYPHSAHPRNYMLVRLSSSGCRKTSKTWRRNSGSSSRKSILWCASDTSPGIGTWPPPISPASEMVWWGARHGRVVTNAVRSPVRPPTRWMREVSRASARGQIWQNAPEASYQDDFSAPGGTRRR